MDIKQTAQELCTTNIYIVFLLINIDEHKNAPFPMSFTLCEKMHIFSIINILAFFVAIRIESVNNYILTFVNDILSVLKYFVKKNTNKDI